MLFFSPNILWQSETKKGQKLFVNPVITENFNGELNRHYLLSLVASNKADCVGSAAMQFCKNSGLLIGKGAPLTNDGLNDSGKNWYSRLGVNAKDYHFINPMAV